MTPAEQAWCVYQWTTKRRSQLDIAKELGYLNPTQICDAIRDFCTPDHEGIYGPERRTLALKKLNEYRANNLPIIKPKPIDNIDIAFARARAEHILMLRAEGLLYKQIGARLGISMARASQICNEMAMRLNRAMRRTRWHRDSWEDYSR